MKAWNNNTMTGILLIFCLCFLSNCTKNDGILSTKKVAPSKMVKWINKEENGLVKTKKVGELIAKVQYRPISYIISNEMRKNDISKKEYEERAKQLEGMDYFSLTLDVEGNRNNVTNYNIGNDMSLQQDRLSYLSFGMQKDIYLMEDGELIPCELYHFERAYNLTSERTFMIGFPKKDTDETHSKTFVLDSPVFGTGPIKIHFEKKDFEKLPKLHIQ